jgi:putative ABC transport system permease protein
VGPIANSPIAVGVLRLVQRIVGKPRRVTQILVEPRPGAGRQVAAELRRLAAGRLDVLPADHELTVLKATASPTEQSSRLFAAIGAIVGFLLAANAMLFTVPERRRWMAEVRPQGYSAGQIALILAFQAMILGVIASLVGIVLGDLLSRTLFSAVPSYLTLAFPIGTHPIIPFGTAALAVGGGVLATLCASAAPLRDLLPSRPIDRVVHAIGKVGHSIDRSTLISSALMGVTGILGVTVLVLLVPSLSILGGALLGLGVLCLVPFLLVIVVRGLLPLSERVRGSMLALALIELDGTATRSIALAGVAGLAIYGSVAVQGAQHDLVNGLDGAIVQYLDSADVWVTTTGDNFLTVDRFKDAGAAEAIAHAPEIASVRIYQGALLDVGARRLWIRARPAGDRRMIQASQLLHGGLGEATGLIRQGGWAAVSNGFASERRLTVGSAFTLPTPAGAMPLRVAAITTNTGWPPGSITMNADDFRRWWQTSDPTALEVNLRPGVGAAVGRRAVAHALGARPGLLVQSLRERQAQYEQSARQGVKSLSEISTLVLIAAALAIACALGATISARKADLAARKAEGYEATQLWRSLLLESAVLLGVGALDGAVCGVYGHALASRWLRLSQGFPAPFSAGAPQVLETLAIVSAIAVAVIGFFGLLAARVPPRLSVQE